MANEGTGRFDLSPRFMEPSAPGTFVQSGPSHMTALPNTTSPAEGRSNFFILQSATCRHSTGLFFLARLMQTYLSTQTGRPVFEITRTLPIGRQRGGPIATPKKESAMNQMMNSAAGWMESGMGMLPLVWIMTLALHVVLNRKNTKIRQGRRFPDEQGLPRRAGPERSTEP